MIKDGKLIRKLRKERNITQEKLVGMHYSRSTLARIESEDLDMRTEMLINLLNRMNVSLEEYQFYKHENLLSKKDEARKNFIDKVLNLQTGDSYLQNLHDEYLQSNDFYYLYLYCLGKILQHKVNKKAIDLTKESQIIKEYLAKIETWGFFELALYANSLYLFNDEFIEQQYSFVLRKMNQFSHIDKFKHLKIRFLLNSIILCFERNKLSLLDQYLSDLFESTMDSDYILGRIFWRFFTDLKNNHQLSDTTLTYNWLHSLGYDDLANNFLEIEQMFRK